MSVASDHLAVTAILVGALGLAAFSACSGDVEPSSSAGAGGSGGAGGEGPASTTSVSEAHGGCYDTFQCGDLFGDFGCLECESDTCQSEVDACAADADCGTYVDCAKACSGDKACIDGCGAEHAAGAAAIAKLATCTACRDSCLSFDCPNNVYPPVSCPP